MTYFKAVFTSQPQGIIFGTSFSQELKEELDLVNEIAFHNETVICLV